MPSSIKSKIAVGIGVLFTLLLSVSIIAIVFINLLSSKTEKLLTANYNTIRYCSEMSNAINNIDNPASAGKFELNLKAQEANITEAGEKYATQQLRNNFELVKNGTHDQALLQKINGQIYDIYMLNQEALEKKNANALHTASKAKLWLSLLTTVFVLISFTLLVNFPGYIANPIRMLTDGIKEVARKNYEKRIFIDNNDEFGEMANAFNQMAKKLYEYEHSNISKLLFEKQRVETIINQMEDAVIGLDAKNNVLFINHKAESLFNLKGSDLTGKYAPDIALYNDLLRTVLQKDALKQPLKIMAEGKESYFSVAYRTVLVEGTSIGEVLTLSDITLFKELDMTKTNLLAAIAHELKMPITSIKSSLKVLTEGRPGPLTNEQKNELKHIAEQTDRLLQIAIELFGITKNE